LLTKIKCVIDGGLSSVVMEGQAM